MTNLGSVLAEVGRLDESIALFRRATGARADAHAGSCLLRAIHFHPDYDARAIEREYAAWEERFARPFAPLSNFYPNDRTPDRRLRIGYVSARFDDYDVGRGMLQLLAHHDRSLFEIACYSDTRAPDGITRQVQAQADLWRHVVGLSDDQLTSQIRQDRIDILVDLNVHTEHPRSLVFARKPAPVQIAGILCPSTIGLRTNYCRVSDPFLGYGGQSPDSSRTICLPQNCWCYQPPDDLPTVNPLPASGNGYITFGCVNPFSSVSDLTLQLWSRVLAAVPGSRLLIRVPAGSARHRVMSRFAAQSIDPSRIRFLDAGARHANGKDSHQLDIALDTFPRTGSADTLDSLSMGVPVITLVGQTIASRTGCSILSNVGLPELCASGAEEPICESSRLPSWQIHGVWPNCAQRFANA